MWLYSCLSIHPFLTEKVFISHKLLLKIVELQIAGYVGIFLELFLFIDL